jgi:hypothetical protein
MYTLKGEIKKIGEIQQISDSFKKRSFVVIDDSSQYEQTIELQLTQDRVDAINQFKVGEKVEVTFFLRGREWESPKDGSVKVFNTLDAWKIDYSGAHADAIHDQTLTAAQMGDDSDQDLPF